MGSSASIYIIAAVVLVIGFGFLYLQGFDIIPSFTKSYRPEYDFCCEITPEAKWTIKITPEEYTGIGNITEARKRAVDKCREINEMARLNEGHCTLSAG